MVEGSAGSGVLSDASVALHMTNGFVQGCMKVISSKTVSLMHDADGAETLVQKS